MSDLFPDLTSDSDHVIAPSEPQEQATLYPDDNPTTMNSGTILEAIITLSSNLGPEPPSKSLVAGSWNGSVDEQSSGDSDDTPDDSDTTSWELDAYYRCPPPEVSQYTSTQGQLDNMFPGHHIS